MPPKLTVFFIVEPPEYEVMACFLAASLRQQFGDQVALVGYCPDIKLNEVSPDVKAVLAKMNCELRSFKVEGRFNPPYPHGNKILATLEPRDTEFSAFFDSDILCLRPNLVDNIIKEGCVSLTPAASMIWGNSESWQLIYDICGMEIPDDRIKLMRQKAIAGEFRILVRVCSPSPNSIAPPMAKASPKFGCKSPKPLMPTPRFRQSGPILTKSACRLRSRNLACSGIFFQKNNTLFLAANFGAALCQKIAKSSPCIIVS